MSLHSLKTKQCENILYRDSISFLSSNYLAKEQCVKVQSDSNSVLMRIKQIEYYYVKNNLPVRCRAPIVAFSPAFKRKNIWNVS